MLKVLDHPVLAQALGRLRDERTPAAEFRATVAELSIFLAYEAARELPTVAAEIRTPVGPASAVHFTTVPILAPVLRAGLALVSGFQRVFPDAATTHIGLYRDPQSLEAVPYYANISALQSGRPVFLLDPMLATGHSAAAAIEILRKAGASAVTFVALIAAKPGVEFLQRRFPDVGIITAALDERLNEHGYIVPGLGDAGDRLFGTTSSVPSVTR